MEATSKEFDKYLKTLNNVVQKNELCYHFKIGTIPCYGNLSISSNKFSFFIFPCDSSDDIGAGTGFSITKEFKRDCGITGVGVISEPFDISKHTNSTPIVEIKNNIVDLSHYDNENGSLYKFCEDKGLNSYEFDIIKRVMRCRKKGQFKEDLEKTKFLIDLYLQEHK